MQTHRDPLLLAFGSTVRAARLKQAMSQEHLALLTGLNRTQALDILLAALMRKAKF